VDIFFFKVCHELYQMRENHPHLGHSFLLLVLWILHRKIKLKKIIIFSPISGVWFGEKGSAKQVIKKNGLKIIDHKTAKTMFYLFKYQIYGAISKFN